MKWYVRILPAVALIVSAGAAAVVGTGASASADTGCVVYPHGESAPVFAAATTASPQVGTITNDRVGRGCVRTGGEEYELCGGGSSWVFVRNMAGYTPSACVELAE